MIIKVMRTIYVYTTGSRTHHSASCEISERMFDEEILCHRELRNLHKQQT